MRAIVLVVLIGILCPRPIAADEISPEEAKKASVIQFTTSSREALEAFQSGLDMLDRIKPRKEAIKEFQRAVTLDPKFAMAHLLVGQCMDDPTAAYTEVLIAAGLAKKASEGEMLWIKSVRALKDKNLAMAERTLHALATSYSDDKRVQYKMGQYFMFRRNDMGKAVEWFKRAIALDPGYAAAYNNLGYAYAWQGQFDLAIETLKKYVELLPKESNPHDSLAEVYQIAGRFDESIAEFKKSLAINSSFHYSHAGLGHSYSFKGDFKKAMESYKKAAELAPSHKLKMEVISWMAAAHVHAGKPEQAVPELKRGIEESLQGPASDWLARFPVELAMVHAEVQQYEEALHALNRGVVRVLMAEMPKKMKKYLVRQCNLMEARILTRLGSVETARWRSKKLHDQINPKKQPREQDMLDQLQAEIFLKEGNTGKALKHLRKADPNNIGTIWLTYRVQIQRADQPQAVAYRKKILEYNRNSLEYALIRARVSGGEKTE